MAISAHPGPYLVQARPSILRKPSRARRWTGFLVLVPILYILYLVQTHHLEYFQIASESMLPALRPGEPYLMAPSREFLRGQIVVFPSPDDHATLLVKRLVAMEGDWVELRDGLLFVNGVANNPPQGVGTAIDLPDKHWKLQSEEVFVAGDSRNNSHD